jgi:hypothetical protein
LGANNVLLPLLGRNDFPMHGHGLDAARGATMGMSLLMGARGAGALMGPLAGGRWAHDRQSRIRPAILGGFLLAAAGYFGLSGATTLGMAVLAVVAAHAGSSANWVFSTTLLQIYTEDRYRGRVFAADYGLCMLGISASSYAAGMAMDLGIGPRTIAAVVGAVMLVPAALWASTLRWK